MTDHSPNLLALYDSAQAEIRVTPDQGMPPDPDYLVAARAERNDAWNAYRFGLDQGQNENRIIAGSDSIGAWFRVDRAEKAYDAALARWWGERTVMEREKFVPIDELPPSSDLAGWDEGRER